MRSVKIPDTEYKALKAIAKKRGCFLTKLLTDAIRQYVTIQKEETSVRP